jgi:NADH:ubiquinone oxidoreductase subunit K
MELRSPYFAMAYRFAIYVLCALLFVFGNSGFILRKEYFIMNLRGKMFWSQSLNFVRLGSLDISSTQLISFLCGMDVGLTDY